MNWMHAIADDPDARVFSYDIGAYPNIAALEDADPRFTFVLKSQADFEPEDIGGRTVDIALFDAGHLVEYSLVAFERVLPSLSPTAIVAVHDTGAHVLDWRDSTPFKSEEACKDIPNGTGQCYRFEGCDDGDKAN